MENKSHCINCYHFYIESKEDISNYRMRHQCTINNLKKKFHCDGHEYVYFIDENKHLCKKDLVYNIKDDDTYLKPIKIIDIESYEFCKDKNCCNQCEDYEKIIYNEEKKVEINAD